MIIQSNLATLGKLFIRVETVYFRPLILEIRRNGLKTLKILKDLMKLTSYDSKIIEIVAKITTIKSKILQPDLIQLFLPQNKNPYAIHFDNISQIKKPVITQFILFKT